MTKLTLKKKEDAQDSTLSEVRGYLIGLIPRPITDDGAPVTWKITKSRYPNGILHVTLFDAQSAPQAERLAFILNGTPALHLGAVTEDRDAHGPDQEHGEQGYVDRLAAAVHGAVELKFSRWGSFQLMTGGYGVTRWWPAWSAR